MALPRIGLAQAEKKKPKALRPRPAINPDNAFWFDAAREHRFARGAERHGLEGQEQPLQGVGLPDPALAGVPDLDILPPHDLDSLDPLAGQPDFDIDPEHRPLFGRHVLVTAGPTHEPIDPVRYIANRSSGKQGFAIAAMAAAAGAQVTLVSGPVNLPTPPGVDRIDVETAEQMATAVMAASK